MLEHFNIDLQTQNPNTSRFTPDEKSRAHRLGTGFETVTSGLRDQRFNQGRYPISIQLETCLSGNLDSSVG